MTFSFRKFLNCISWDYLVSIDSQMYITTKLGMLPCIVYKYVLQESKNNLTTELNLLNFKVHIFLMNWFRKNVANFLNLKKVSGNFQK